MQFFLLHLVHHASDLQKICILCFGIWRRPYLWNERRPCFSRKEMIFPHIGCNLHVHITPPSRDKVLVSWPANKRWCLIFSDRRLLEDQWPNYGLRKATSQCNLLAKHFFLKRNRTLEPWQYWASLFSLSRAKWVNVHMVQIIVVERPLGSGGGSGIQLVIRVCCPQIWRK